MADDRIAIQTPPSPDQWLDSELLTVGANLVKRERDQLAGRLAGEIAGVKNVNPAESEYGLAVREIATTNAVTDARSSANLAAGASADLDGTTIANTKRGLLLGVDLASSAACKWEIQTRAGAAIVTRTVLFTSGLAGQMPSLPWRAPSREFVPLTGNGVDTNFRVRVTNLDARNAADAYATLLWDEM